MQLAYTIYDSKAEIYLPPFWVPTKGIAIRAFEDCVNSEDHQFAKHPHDYTLFSLGSFDQDTGKFNAQTPISIGNGLEFLRPDKFSTEGTPVNEPLKPTISDSKNSGDSA